MLGLSGCILQNPEFLGAHGEGGPTSQHSSEGASGGESGGGQPGDGASMSPGTDSGSGETGPKAKALPDQGWGVMSVQAVAHAWNRVTWTSLSPPKLFVLAVGWGQPPAFEPSPGVQPTVGGEILYVGSAPAYEHRDARPGERAFYKLYAMREDGSFTAALLSELEGLRWPLCPANKQSCYEHPQALALGKAVTPSGKVLELVDGDGGGPQPFRVWKEFAGDRVLRADGRDQWSFALALDGRTKANEFYRPRHWGTPRFPLVGRVCPLASYKSEDDEAEESTCLYFSATSELASLGEAGESQTQAGQIGLGNWAGHTKGLWDPRWYVGNVQYCAQKGMRLPTLYEFAIDVAKSDNFPQPRQNFKFSSKQGLRVEFEGGYWSASAAALLGDSYWSASSVGAVVTDRRTRLRFVCVIH